MSNYQLFQKFKMIDKIKFLLSNYIFLPWYLKGRCEFESYYLWTVFDLIDIQVKRVRSSV